MNKALVPIMLTLLLAATLLSSAPLSANPAPGDSPAENALAATATTVYPIADAYVNSSAPSTNYGASTPLRVDGSPVVNSYLRFDVQVGSAPIAKATLRVYATSNLTAGYDVRAVTNNTWTENGITFSNAPAMGAVIGQSGAVKSGAWNAIDVSGYVVGNGTITLGLTNAGTTALALASRESSYRPQLVVMTGTAASPTATRTAARKPSITPTKTPVPPTATRVSPTATRLPPTATPLPPAATPTAIPIGSIYQPSAPIRAAFFYPWFPDAWTQSSIFPFTNYHPSFGYYSSIDDGIIDRQITLAAQAHLDVFISSWWGQGQHTDTALRHILMRSERAGSPNPNLRWAVYYELESQGDPSAATLTADLKYLATAFFNEPAYLKVNGKPVVFVYAAANDACGMANRWVQAKQAVGGNVYLVLKVFAGYASCANQPDSWHQYSPAVGYDQQGTLSAAASPGFWLKGSAVRLARDPVRFESDVKKMVASRAFWQLVTTWSEWGEGTAVEPATEWGNTYIDILTRNVPAR